MAYSNRDNIYMKGSNRKLKVERGKINFYVYARGGKITLKVVIQRVCTGGLSYADIIGKFFWDR